MVFAGTLILLLTSSAAHVRAQEPAAQAAEAPELAQATEAEAPELAQATVETLVLEYSSDTLFDLGISGIYKRFDAGAGSTGPGILSLADLAFPSLNSSGLGLGMFLDKIAIGEGEFEFLIQALEQDERIEILSRPRVLLEKGQTQAVVQTVERVPYETTKVVGTTTVQITEFKDTGVTLDEAC
jgi:type II secretory pathway component GspD/PulD (secretin)